MSEIKSNDLSDALPLPTLDNAPKTQHLKSYLLVLSLLFGGIFGAYLYGFELLQPSSNSSWLQMGIVLVALVGVGATTLWWTGSHRIDWWELVLGYWWFSMPIAAAAGLLLIKAEEGTAEIQDVD